MGPILYRPPLPRVRKAHDVFEGRAARTLAFLTKIHHPGRGGMFGLKFAGSCVAHHLAKVVGGGLPASRREMIANIEARGPSFIFWPVKSTFQRGGPSDRE